MEVHKKNFRSLHYNWTYISLGVLFIIVAGFVFSRPVSSYLALVVYFALTFFISGALRSIFAVTNREVLNNWGWYLAGGLFDVLLGILLFARLDMAALFLPYYVGFFLMISSISVISKASDLKIFTGGSSGGVMFLGVLGLIFSLILLLNPILGIGTIVAWTALGFLTGGIFYIYLGTKLKAPTPFSSGKIIEI